MLGRNSVDEGQDGFLHIFLVDGVAEADRFILEVSQRLGQGDARDTADVGQHVEGIVALAQGQGFADDRREFIGMCRRHDDRMAAFVEALAMAVHADAVSDGRVRVEEITEIIVDVVDDGFRFIVVDPAAFKFLAQRLQFVSGNAHLPRFQEVLFPLGHFGGIFFGDVEQEAFKIARQEDVHGRARRRVEVAVHVIDAGFKEVGQDLVLVRCANQFADRHAHLLGKIASQDIAEVPRRDDDIERFAFADGAVIDEGDIRRYVVGDLREQAADVDGIGAGEEDALVVGIGHRNCHK